MPRWPTFVFVACLCLIWGPLIYQLAAQWSVYEQYSYGWAVPFLTAFTVYKRLKVSKLQITNVGRFGVAGILVLTLLYFPVRILHEANPAWRLTSWLWTLLAVGLTLL